MLHHFRLFYMNERCFHTLKLIWHLFGQHELGFNPVLYPNIPVLLPKNHQLKGYETDEERNMCPPRRGIEPRSPAWQAGILTTILTRKWCLNILDCFTWMSDAFILWNSSDICLDNSNIPWHFLEKIMWHIMEFEWQVDIFPWWSSG